MFIFVGIFVGIKLGLMFGSGVYDDTHSVVAGFIGFVVGTVAFGNITMHLGAFVDGMVDVFSYRSALRELEGKINYY